MPVGADEMSGYAKDVQNLPLLFEPGEKWQYGVRLCIDADFALCSHCRLGWCRLGWDRGRARVWHVTE